MRSGRLIPDRKWIAVGVAGLLVLIYVLAVVGRQKTASVQTAVVTDGSGETAGNALFGRSRLLFYFRDDDGSAMLFSVDADLAAKRIGVAALPDDRGYELNGMPAAIGTVYAAAGLNGVKAAAGARAGAAFDRAFICTQAQFVKVTEAFDPVTVFVPVDVVYSGASVAVDLKAGVNTISGTDLYAALKYCGGDAVSYLRQGELFAAVLRSYLTSENVAKGEKLFNTIVNSAQTDITAYDYAEHIDRLTAAAAAPDLVFENTGMLKEEDSEG